jgi:hypothetical protein
MHIRSYLLNWHITQTIPFLRGKTNIIVFKDDAGSIKINNYKYEWIYDPKMKHGSEISVYLYNNTLNKISFELYAIKSPIIHFNKPLEIFDDNQKFLGNFIVCPLQFKYFSFMNFLTKRIMRNPELIDIENNGKILVDPFFWSSKSEFFDLNKVLGLCIYERVRRISIGYSL